MKILLLGANGQIGGELRRALALAGELTVLARDTDGSDIDFERPQKLLAIVERIQPDVVVNAVAYTNVDGAESESDLTHKVNAVTPGMLATCCAELGAAFIHYSTDYVFDGAGTAAWTETDAPHPINVYGASKLEGETRIATAGGRYFIMRTSWVYAARGRNFLLSMLRLMTRRDQLDIVDDQIGAPTGASLIADVTAHAINTSGLLLEQAGIYHLAAQGEVTWFGFARYIQERMMEFDPEWKGGQCRLLPTSSEKFGAQAARPANSRLDCSKLQAAFGFNLPNWRVGVDQVLEKLA